MKKDDFSLLLNTPGQLATNYVKWAERIHEHPGITWGIPAIDRRVIPMRPGDLVGLVGRPGAGKSCLLAYLAKREAANIIGRKAVKREVVVYATWESSAEEIENFWMSSGEYSASDVAWGRVPLDVIRSKMAKRASMPIFTIGYSIANAGKLQPRMTLPAVLGAIETMERDYSLKPTLLLFDYLQLIPIAGARNRVEQVLEAPPRIKELALRVGAPAVCGIQASRDVDRRRDKIPEPDDCQWGSSIEQAADKLFGLWRPIKTEGRDAEPIEFRGKLLPITENLFFLRMIKQRWEQGRHTWALYFSPQYLRLAELEMTDDTGK